MGEGLLLPDEQILRLHLGSGRFRSGTATGWWRLVSGFPIVMEQFWLLRNSAARSPQRS